MEINQKLIPGNMWRICLLGVSLAILLFKLYELIFTKKGKRPVGKLLDVILLNLEKVKPMDWLTFLLGKSIVKRIILTIVTILLL